MALNTTGITHISPSTRKFKLNQANQFYIDGTGLAGASLDDIEGTITSGNHIVAWNDVSVLDNSSDTQMKVEGTPAKADKDTFKQGDFDSDSGDVTPTVSNDGSTVQNAFPTDYGT